MPFIVIGLNYRKTPVSLRERLAFTHDQAVQANRALKSCEGLSESLILSTCNRIEVYAIADPLLLGSVHIKTLLARKAQLQPADLDPYVYEHRDSNALNHLFRVSSSLDSMVIGEPQINGQVKEAYQWGVEAGSVGSMLHKIFHQAFKVAKRIRTETGIGEHAVSLSYAAVELAKQIFGPLNQRQVLLIGAGEMATLAAKHLLHQGAVLTIINRSITHARALAHELHAHALELNPQSLSLALSLADVVISSTGATDPIVYASKLREIMKQRKHRPIFFIDLAVPRDIDPKVQSLSHVYLYDVDDLQSVLRENWAERKRAASLAETWIREEVLHFEKQLKTLNVVPTIVALRNHYFDLAEIELQRYFKSNPHLSPKERKKIQAFTKSLIQKLLHQPTVQLKRASHTLDREALISWTHYLFDLDQAPLKSTASTAHPLKQTQVAHES